MAEPRTVFAEILPKSGQLYTQEAPELVSLNSSYSCNDHTRLCWSNVIKGGPSLQTNSLCSIIFYFLF